MTDTRTIETGTTDVLGEVTGGVGRITLNRPDRRNALSPAMLTGLASLLTEMEAADDVGAVLITGAGKAFCAGGDVKGFAERGGEGGGTSESVEARAERQLESQRATAGKIYSMAKPVVAVLPGAAAGAGLGVALAADLRIGTLRAVMVTAFAGVGLSGDYGTTWLLNRLVGPARARRMLFLSERVEAQECLDLGLLNWVVPAEELEEFSLGIARRLAGGPRPCLRNMKDNLVHAFDDDLDAAMAREVPHHLECGLSEDHREAVRAFVEKRDPVFRHTPVAP
ncbi:MAG: hypothetical protein GEV11_14215 [Streptosporangiales bacterium]|nr:hypothetical protein [Streptosporangiales bacterium]